MNLEILINLRDQFETITESCDVKQVWKSRTITHWATTSGLLSITFFPTSKKDSTVLFIQKEGVLKKQVGFVNCLLTNQQQEEWNALPSFPHSSIVHTQQDLLSSLHEVPSHLKEDVQTCLEYFLMDTTTSALGLTYQKEGQFITYGWIKA